METLEENNTKILQIRKKRMFIIFSTKKFSLYDIN